MKITAISRYVRLSPSKGLGFARLLKGLSVAEALKATEFSDKKASFLIGKALRSAIANAEKNAGLSADDFHVEDVIVEKGPFMKRYWHRSRGMARPILKRTSHIRVVIADGK